MPEPDFLRRQRERIRYETDPVYRAQKKASARAYYDANRERVKARQRTQESRARAAARQRERYATDPEYRERVKAAARVRGTTLRRYLPYLHKKASGICPVCVESLPADPMGATIDHIVPVVDCENDGWDRKERDNPLNLQAVHKECNQPRPAPAHIDVAALRLQIAGVPGSRALRAARKMWDEYLARRQRMDNNPDMFYTPRTGYEKKHPTVAAPGSRPRKGAPEPDRTQGSLF